MSGSYWKQVHERGLAGPHRPAARRPDRRADPDARLDPTPTLRDGPPTPRWPPGSTGASTTTCSPASATAWPPGWPSGSASSDTDSVFRRSFSALMLGECIARDNTGAPGPGRARCSSGATGSRPGSCASGPARLRARQGLGARRRPRRRRARRPRRLAATSADPELTVLLDVIADRLLLPVDRLFTNGEPDRLAAADDGGAAPQPGPAAGRRAVDRPAGRRPRRPTRSAATATRTSSAATPRPPARALPAAGARAAAARRSRRPAAGRWSTRCARPTRTPRS